MQTARNSENGDRKGSSEYTGPRRLEEVMRSDLKRSLRRVFAAPYVGEDLADEKPPGR